MPVIKTIRWKSKPSGDAISLVQTQEKEYQPSTRSLAHLSSIVVVHDGSPQGHRALQAGLQLASRSFSKLDFMGIFGINSETGEASTSSEDCQRQNGWLSSLAEMYLEEARADGVIFSSRFFPANDPCALLDTLYHMDFDLIVIPKSLTRFGNHGERLMPSIVSRINTNVLVCP
jgi:hypothetical protein